MLASKLRISLNKTSLKIFMTLFDISIWNRSITWLINIEAYGWANFQNKRSFKNGSQQKNIFKKLWILNFLNLKLVPKWVLPNSLFLFEDQLVHRLTGLNGDLSFDTYSSKPLQIYVKLNQNSGRPRFALSECNFTVIVCSIAC